MQLYYEHKIPITDDVINFSQQLGQYSFDGLATNETPVITNHYEM